MHEYSLMHHVVDEIQARLAEDGEIQGAVRAVRLTVGQLDIHTAEAFRQAFVVATRGTRLDGAALELTVVAAHIKCPACGYEAAAAEGELDSHAPCAACPRCGAVCLVEGGHGIRAIELTVDDGAVY